MPEETPACSRTGYAATWPPFVEGLGRYVVIDTVRSRRENVIDGVIAFYDRYWSSMHGSLVCTRGGYPRDGSREAKWRFLRKEGVRIAKVAVRVLDAQGPA